MKGESAVYDDAVICTAFICLFQRFLLIQLYTLFKMDNKISKEKEHRFPHSDANG